MNTRTEITTPARRIARDINTTADVVTVAYDAEGRSMETWSTGMWFANPDDAPASRLVMAGRRGQEITARDAQDMLDAEAWADSEEATDTIHRQVEIGFYLEELAQARAEEL